MYISSLKEYRRVRDSEDSALLSYTCTFPSWVPLSIWRRVIKCLSDLVWVKGYDESPINWHLVNQLQSGISLLFKNLHLCNLVSYRRNHRACIIFNPKGLAVPVNLACRPTVLLISSTFYSGSKIAYVHEKLFLDTILPSFSVPWVWFN